MRLDMMAASALIIAGSAAIFGNLGRAAAPSDADQPFEAAAKAAGLDAVPCAPARRKPMQPHLTSITFLDAPDESAFVPDLTRIAAAARSADACATGPAAP